MLYDKKLCNKIISLSLVLVMIVGMMGISVSKAEEAIPLINVAKNKPVYTTSAVEDSVWGSAYLTDGLKMGSWPLPAGETLGWRTAYGFAGTGTEGRETDTSITVNLEEVCNIHKIVLYPRGNSGICFPSDYSIYTSQDAVSWTKVATVTGDTEADGKVRNFDVSQIAKFVKINVTKASLGLDGFDRAIEMSEIEVLAVQMSNPRRNMSIGATVTSDSSFTSDLSTVWREQNLVDGDVMASWPLPGIRTLGWRSYPLASRDTKITLNMVLKDSVMIDEFVLYPRGNGGICFPNDYTILISEDGTTYTPVVQATENPKVAEEPRFHTINEQRAKYVRIELSKASQELDGMDIAYELSEIEVWGKSETKLKTDRPDIWLSTGESDTIAAYLIDSTETPHLSFRVIGGPLIDLKANGTFTAIASGNTIVEIKDSVTGATAECNIKVYSEKEKNILISVPVWGNTSAITEEQFTMLRDADIDAVMAVGHDMKLDLAKKMFQTAKNIWDDTLNNNLRVFAYTYTEGITPLSTDNQVLDYVNKYKNTPTLLGYHVEDEPAYPNNYARLERILKKNDTDAIADVNFLPGIAYGNYNTFRKALTDYTRLTDNYSSYLSFDNYPFGVADNSVDETSLFGNFEAMRKAGITSEVPYAFYVQSVGTKFFNYRRPNESTLRYHLASAMAYGFKWIKYFSWYVPGATGTGEDALYSDAIMDKNFNKTEMYDVAANLNKQIHNVGTILARVDATEVFHTGSTIPLGCTAVDSKFFAQPVENPSAIVSLMRDPQTSEQYLMIVNKNIASSQTISFNLSNVSSIVECDKDNAGATITANFSNGVLTRSYLPGEFALYKISSDKDLRVNIQMEIQSDNLFANAKATASGSVGNKGWFIENVNDGKRNYLNVAKGWKEDKAAVSDSFVMFDMMENKSFNRIDIYPAGDAQTVGHLFPEKIQIYISNDKENWQKIFESDKIVQPVTEVPVCRFNKATARYVKIVIPDCISAAIGEIECYNDSGTIPLPEETLYVDPATTPNDNLAFRKEVKASASYIDGAWNPSRLTDGFSMESWPTDKGLGFCAYSATQDVDIWTQIDLESIYTINKVVLYPRGNGGICFPSDYQIQTSLDGINFTTVYTKTGDSNTGENPRTITFANTKATYVRVFVTKLTDEKDGAFYACQISEIEAYNMQTLTGIRITQEPLKKSYKVGEIFDPSGMVITADYDYAPSAVVTDYTISPIEALSTGDTYVTISYKEFGVTKTVLQLITVSDLNQSDLDQKVTTDKESDVPNTGDNIRIIPYGIIAICSIILSIVLSGKRRFRVMKK